MSESSDLDGADASDAPEASSPSEGSGDGYALDSVTDADRAQADPRNIAKMWRFIESFARKSGSYLHPQREITEFLVIGLAKHIEEVGRPLCPCNFYEDKAEEATRSTWVCPCEEMQRWKYCH